MMPTFMTRPTFEFFASTWQELRAELPADGIGPQNIFVPWAGPHMVAHSRGIYFVGIADLAQDECDPEQSFEAACKTRDVICRSKLPGLSPFWQFVDEITRKLLGAPYDQAQDRWGWSNLWKIGADKCNNPRGWPAPLRNKQRPACIASLREEISKLHHSLITVTAEPEYDILYSTVAPREEWDTEPRLSETNWLQDIGSENLFVHGYHPNYMKFKPELWSATVSDTLSLVRNRLPAF